MRRRTARGRAFLLSERGPISLRDECSRALAVQPLVDPFGRAIAYVRVSVTDRCDYRCVYCMSEDMNFLPKRDILSLEELDRLCSTFVSLAREKFA